MSKTAFQVKNGLIEPLKTYSGTMVYKLRRKVMKGLELTKEERLWLTEQMNMGNESTRYITHEGWCFDFRPILNVYHVWDCGDWAEYVGTDMESIADMLGVDVDEISRYPKKELKDEEIVRLCEYEGPIYETLPILNKSQWHTLKKAGEKAIKNEMEMGKTMLFVRVK